MAFKRGKDFPFLQQGDALKITHFQNRDQENQNKFAFNYLSEKSVSSFYKNNDQEEGQLLRFTTEVFATSKRRQFY